MNPKRNLAGVIIVSDDQTVIVLAPFGQLDLLSDVPWAEMAEAATRELGNGCCDRSPSDES
jgi:hypothetical protein